MADFYDIYEKYNKWNQLPDSLKSFLGVPGVGAVSQFLPKDYSKYEPLFSEYQKLLEGSSSDYLGFQNLANQYGLGGAEFEKWMDNMISRQNTQEAWNQQEKMAQNDLLYAADQLGQLGLSSSGVLQTGGSSAPSVASAQNVKENVALKKLQERNSMTKSILGMVGMLGSVGIHGATAAYAKKAASSLVHQTASQVFDKNGVLKGTTRTKSWNS